MEEFGAGKIDAEAAEMAGSEVISKETVERMAREVHGGTAPGPDGIPLELWKGHLSKYCGLSSSPSPEPKS